MKTQLVLLLLIISMSGVYSQDIIIQKKNNVEIKCKIIEIGLLEVKYVLPEISETVTMVIAKEDVSKIVFENGEEMTFVDEMKSSHHYDNNRKNAIKFDFLSPFSSFAEFTYERNLKPGSAIEGSLGIIGFGNDIFENNASGVFGKFGYKFIKDPDFYLRGMRYAHILKGSYIKPELALTYFKYDKDNYYNGTMTRESVFGGSAHLIFGQQWVFNNRFGVDLYSGIGYGFSTTKDKYQHYAFGIIEGDFRMTWLFGLRVAWLF